MIIICPNDEELLAVASGDEPSAELKSHLQECSRCVRKIDGLKSEVKVLQNAFGSILPPAGSSAGRTSSPAMKLPPTTKAPPPVPPNIGKYLVVGALGSGSQASVYRAVHPTLDEQVVIKLAARSPEDEDASKTNRLVAEGRTLYQLKHPNIGRVYDLDFFERRPFIVMEYVRGRSLDQYVRDRMALTTGDMIRLGAKLARALENAHRLGIVHQDIKPQNIIIDEKDEPKLIDFGMARLNGAWTEHEHQPLGGTIQYMAPEQARGETASITGQSDVFALGAVLYFLVTNKAPFSGGSRDENLARARSCSFDSQAIETANVSAGLKSIVLKALAAKPVDRFAGAGEMADSLESLERAATRRKRLRRAVPLLLAIVAIIVAVIAWPRQAPVPAAGQLLITPDGASSLEGNLPLVTGQKIKIQGVVPRNTPTLLFWIGSGGQVFRMPVSQIHAADQFDHVFSPEESRTTAVSGKSGTEFLLMISGKGLDDPTKIDQVESQLRSFFATHSLGELPSTGAVIVDTTGAHARYLDGGIKSRDPGAETADACAQVSSPLDKLSQALKADGYFFTGIAVAHEDAHD